MIAGIEFLQTLVDDDSKVRGYSVINVARSALSAVLVLPGGIPFGEHPRVCMFMKGVFNMRPPIPRYQEVWDTDLVLEMFKKREWNPVSKISIKMLSQKVTMLVLLCSGERPQILRAMNVVNMEITGDSFCFDIKNDQIKQGRIGYKPKRLVLKAFPKDERICVYKSLRTYLKRTLNRRGKVKSMFLTLNKPYKEASRDTLSRWSKETLSLAGVDTNKFKAGSTRAASVSQASKAGGTLGEILNAGGWSQETTFTRWYKRPILKQNRTLGEIILR